MAYEGYVDWADAGHISGWVFDNARPDDPLAVEILADGRPVVTVRADRPRQDLAALGKGNGVHGFSHTLPPRVPRPAAPLVARVAGRRWLLQMGARPPVNLRMAGTFAHTLEYGLPAADHAFGTVDTDPKAAAAEAALGRRLIAAHAQAVAADPHRRQQLKPDNWSGLTQDHHQGLADLFRRQDAAGLTAYLRDAHAQGITYGITQGDVTTGILRDRADARELVVAQYLDLLASLAESLGVLDVESPEQHGQWGENAHGDPDALVAKIEAAVGIPLPLPAVVGSALGIKLQGRPGVLTGRDLLALYAALRLRAVSADAGLPDPAVCEIGGGLGGVAYYAHRLGLRRYTVIDLPLVGALQGYFLIRSLPGANVRLFGEPADGPPADIELLPTYAFNDPARRYDVLFNMDSIPEMNVDYSLAYLRQARRNVGRLFLSINQEARAPQTPTARQSVVRDLVGEVGGYDRRYRFRHWLKAGYVEELYAVTAV